MHHASEGVYYRYCVITVVIFIIFVIIGCFLKVSVFSSIALGAIASFIYLSTLDLPSKVTEKDKVTIHIVYLLNVIIIVTYVVYSVLKTRNCN